jgi:hypothetical protein
MAKRTGEGALTDQIAELLEERSPAEAKRIVRALCDRFEVRTETSGGDGRSKKRERPSVTWGNSLGGMSSVDLDDFDRQVDKALGRDRDRDDDDD